MNTLDRKRIIALLQQKNIQHYGFSILFFFIFTFFVIFAIRPNIITAFSLQRELQELRLKDKQYEQQIIKIVNYQSLLEGYRDDLPLLDEALPSTPLLGRAIAVVEKTATDSGVLLSNIEVQKVQYQERTPDDRVKSFHIIANAQTEFSRLQSFMDRLLDQRRLTVIESIDITRVQFTSDGPNGITNYTIDIKIGCHYL